MRRNPNKVYDGEIDIDTRDHDRGLAIRSRLLINHNRLMDDRQRTIGLDIPALNCQIYEKSMKMDEALRQKSTDSHESYAHQSDYLKSLSETQLMRLKKSREYASILESQCLERRMKDVDTPDFDSKYLIGHSVHSRDDPVAQRMRLKAHQGELLTQIENKRNKTSLSPEKPATSPISGDSVKNYREKVNASFISGNKAIIEQKNSVRTSPTITSVSLPESTPHGSATDFRGFSKERTRRLLDENEFIIESKKELCHKRQLEELARRVALEDSARIHNEQTREINQHKRQIQKECVSISFLNSELRNQESPKASPDEYFVNRFGKSLVYSLLE